jgi:hypothetical protein
MSWLMLRTELKSMCVVEIAGCTLQKSYLIQFLVLQVQNVFLPSGFICCWSVISTKSYCRYPTVS